MCLVMQLTAVLRRRSRLLPGVRMMIIAGAMLIGLFQFSRLGLLISHWRLADECTWQEIATSFVVGVRFDLAMTAYALLPLFVVAGVAHYFGPRAERAVYCSGLIAYVGLFTLLAIAEVHFFDEFHCRFNSLALQYWSQPATVLNMIWYGFPVVRCLLVLAIFILLAACFIRSVSRWIAPVGAPAIEQSWRAQLLQSGLLVLVLVVCARGGLRGTPLHWGDSVQSSSMFANQLTLNGVWCLGRAIVSRHRHDQLEQLWNQALPTETAVARTRQMLCQPGDTLALDDERYPLLRTFASDPANDQWPVLKQRGPINVVVILMESFSARFVGAVGSDDDYTPEFNRLAREGILYDRCFSVGTHTHQANFAVFGGFPNLPGYESLMESDTVGTQPLESLPKILKRLGYETRYCYNGSLAWENLRGFFRMQGVDHFVDRDDFSQSASFDHTWGARDYDLFQRVDQELSQSRQPFCMQVLTISNHAPFELPVPLPFPAVTDQDSMNQRFNGIRYADWALGEFFKLARQRPWFDNTLFVMVGDHGFSVAPLLTEVRLLRFHVPLLFYGPGVLGTEERRIHSVVSQLDIVPTIAAMLDAGRPHQSWGRNLLAVPDDDPGLAVFKPSDSSPDVGMARGDMLLIRTSDGQNRLYRYSLGFPPQAEPQHDQQIAGEMESDLHAYLQTATRVLRERTATPHDEILLAMPKRAPSPSLRAELLR